MSHSDENWDPEFDQMALEQEQRRRADSDEARLARHVYATFSTPEGKKVLDWMRVCCFGDAIMGPHEPLPGERETLLRVGQQWFYNVVRQHFDKGKELRELNA